MPKCRRKPEVRRPKPASSDGALSRNYAVGTRNRLHPYPTAVELRLECTFSMLPRSARNERGEGKSNKTKLLSPTHNNWAHSLCRCAASAPNRPNAYAAEKIRDVGDNVPPRWEGCCPQRPIIFLRDARTNNSSSFVGREGEDRFRFRRQFP